MKKIIFMIVVIMGLKLFSQELPKIIPPSPTVSNLMNFEEVPIDLYTGQPNISLPLFSQEIDKRTQLVLALRYSTLGVRVNQRSSWVGTGWSLEVGGTISRTVRGIPDELKKGMSGNSTKTGVLHNLDFWNYENLIQYDKDEFNWRVKGTSLDQYDSEIDLYQFSLLGTSGRFIIILENGILVPKLLSKDQNVKIELNYDPTTFEISDFTIIDAFGNIYLFSEIERTESIPVTGVKPQGGSGIINEPNGAVIVNNSAWHLTKISKSNKDVLATIQYDSIQEYYTSSITRTYNNIETQVSYDFIHNSYNQGILKPESTVSYYSSSTLTKKPTKIVFKDQTQLRFEMQYNHPETGGAVLKEIVLEDKEFNEIKRYSLIHSQTDRLWLDSIEEKFGVEKLVYGIEYNEKVNLPPFDSQIDEWGYNEGYIEQTTSCYDRMSFDFDAVKKGLIKRINYPTGGFKEFVFEHNTFSYIGAQQITSQEYMNNPENISLSLLSENFVASNDLPPGRGKMVEVTHDQDVFISSNLQVGTQADAARFRISLTNLNDGVEYWVNLDATCYRIHLTAGMYTFGLKLIDGLTLDPYYVEGNAKLFYETQNSILSKYLLGGGVRIKNISFYDGIDNINPQRKISYNYNEPLDPQVSSGSVDSKLGNLSQNYNVSPVKYLFSGLEMTSETFSPTIVEYNTATKGVNAKLTKGGYVGYKYVKVEEENNGSFLNTYTTSQDYYSPSNCFIFPFYPEPNIDYKRGLLLKHEVFNEQGYKLSESINQYSFVEDIIAPSFRILDYESCEWKQFYDTYDSYMNKIFPEFMPKCGVYNSPCILKIYSNCGASPLAAVDDNLTSGWAQLIETVNNEYFYDESGNSTVGSNKLTYSYNNYNFQPNIISKYYNIDGVEKEEKEEIFFSIGSYPSSKYSSSDNAVIDKMRTLNIINTPIYTKKYKNQNLTASTQNVFGEFSLDQIEIKKINTLKGVYDPITNKLEDRIVYTDYDTKGNPLEVSKKDGTHIVYIWGYQQSKPIAKIVNATYAQVLSSVPNLQVLSNTDTDRTTGATGSEGALRTALNNLRTTLPNSQVTTYTYDPLIGVTSITDPMGQVLYYHYDEFNRLEYILDKDGKVISKNEYHYKN